MLSRFNCHPCCRPRKPGRGGTVRRKQNRRKTRLHILQRCHTRIFHALNGGETENEVVVPAQDTPPPCQKKRSNYRGNNKPSGQVMKLRGRGVPAALFDRLLPSTKGIWPFTQMPVIYAPPIPAPCNEKTTKKKTKG